MDKEIVLNNSPDKHYSETLSERYRFQKAIIDSTSLSIITVTPHGVVTSFNKAAENTLGYTAAEIIGVVSLEIFHDREEIGSRAHDLSLELGVTIEPNFEALIAKPKYKNVSDEYEWKYIRKDGSHFPALVSVSALRDEKGLLIGYVCVALDITAQKEFSKAAEEERIRNLEVAALELQDHNQELDEFAHIISHNLRSPVGNIKALINFINEKSTLRDYQLIFEKISTVANNLSETMNELMETLMIKKSSEIERMELRFKDILDKVIQSLEGDLIECGAEVTFDFNNAPKIYYSKPYLESIVQNLVTNAIKYRSPDRSAKIHISSDIGKNGVELRVSDNGLGIDLEKFGGKLFGFQKTFHGNKEAKGVGLFLTKTQIEALGGSITAESEVNKGTTFIIQF